jgi:hypothetical protein
VFGTFPRLFQPTYTIRANVLINASAKKCWEYCWNMSEAEYKAIESALQKVGHSQRFGA